MWIDEIANNAKYRKDEQLQNLTILRIFVTLQNLLI